MYGATDLGYLTLLYKNGFNEGHLNALYQSAQPKSRQMHDVCYPKCLVSVDVGDDKFSVFEAYIIM